MKHNDSNKKKNSDDNNSEILYEQQQIAKDIELEKEQKKNLVVDQINKLYDNVFNKYQNANLLVYNPNILSRLTKENFMDWIIKNNKEILDLFC